MSTPLPASSGTQAASEPRRGQLAPPRASTVARAATCRSPWGTAKRRAPSCAQPSQRWRMWNCTPRPRSRCSHARSSGAAFISAGNTRPEVPTKVSTPSPCAQARRCSAPKRSSSGAICALRAPKRAANGANGSECVRFSPPLPASKNLRPAEGMASNTCTATPAWASTSAAMRPAGPAPMTAASQVRGREGEMRGSVNASGMGRSSHHQAAARPLSPLSRYAVMWHMLAPCHALLKTTCPAPAPPGAARPAPGHRPLRAPAPAALPRSETPHPPPRPAPGPVRPRGSAAAGR